MPEKAPCDAPDWQTRRWLRTATSAPNGKCLAKFATALGRANTGFKLSDGTSGNFFYKL